MMHDMENSWHWGFGFGHWGFGILIWLVIILLIAVLIKQLFSDKK